MRCPIWLFFCSSSISCFADMWFRYSLNDSEILPAVPIITGIAFVFKIPHSLYFYRNNFIFKLFFDSLLLLSCFCFTYALCWCSFVTLCRQFVAFLLLTTWLSTLHFNNQEPKCAELNHRHHHNHLPLLMYGHVFDVSPPPSRFNDFNGACVVWGSLN